MGNGNQPSRFTLFYPTQRAGTQSTFQHPAQTTNFNYLKGCLFFFPKTGREKKHIGHKLIADILCACLCASRPLCLSAVSVWWAERPIFILASHKELSILSHWPILANYWSSSLMKVVTAVQKTDLPLYICNPNHLDRALKFKIDLILTIILFIPSIFDLFFSHPNAGSYTQPQITSNFIRLTL